MRGYGALAVEEEEGADASARPGPVGLQAALLMSLSAACFATNALFIKLLGTRYSAASFELVLARGVTALLLNIVVLARMDVGESAAVGSSTGARCSVSRLLMRERGGNGLLLALRAGFGFCGVACDYYALVSLPLPVASVLIFTSPVWAALGASAVLGEPLRPAHVAALSCCLCGVVLVVWQPQPVALPAPWALRPCAVAVLGAMLNAAAFVTMRAIGTREPTPVTVQAYLLVCSSAAPLAMLAAGQAWVSPAPREIGTFALIGVLGLLGQDTMTRSFQLAPAGPASLFRYLEVVLAFVYGRWVLGQRASVHSWAGAALVVAACVASAAPDRAVKEPRSHAERARARHCEGATCEDYGVRLDSKSSW